MTIDKYPKKMSGMSAKKADVEVGEGTKVIDLPFNPDKGLTAPGHKARTVKDLQKGSRKTRGRIFP